jgi:hypothetical protein
MRITETSYMDAVAALYYTTEIYLPFVETTVT